MNYVKPEDRTHAPTWNRVDPAGCGCTDCLTGWSIPFSSLYDQADLAWVYAGNEFDDASGATLAEWDAKVATSE